MKNSRSATRLHTRGRFLSALLAMLLLASSGAAQDRSTGLGQDQDQDQDQDRDRYRVLPADFNSQPEQQMMRAYLRRLTHAALDRRRGELEEALQDRERFALYQQSRRAFLQEVFQGTPSSPLNARVTGVKKAGGFTIEKVLFESRLGFFVTANVYRPEGDGPFPAVLHPCGHTENGKAFEAYQMANLLLVRNGFLVLCYDPIGQGERKQILGRNGKPALRASGEHQQLGVAPLLLGTSLGAQMLWDARRAVDYLCRRADVDPQRIGCMGNSGGGNMTSYLMAVDPRIAAAAPGCFITTHRRKNERPGPGDAEQNLPGQIAAGFDHPDFVLCRAPKPTLILAATHDFVPIEGTWEAYRQAKRAYSLLGHPERVQLVEANEKHGFSSSLQLAAVRFFARWLQPGRSEPTDEVGLLRINSERLLQVTESGQVVQLPDAVSLLQQNARQAEALAERRQPLAAADVRRLTGVRPLSRIPTPKVQRVGEQEQPQKYLFRPEAGIVLPALYFPGGVKSPILIVHEQGMAAAVEQAKSRHAEGHAVLLVDVRDTGETKTRNWRFFGADFYIALMLDRSWVGMQTEDILVAARWLAETEHVDSVQLRIHGRMTPVGLHAIGLEPQLFGGYEINHGVSSWRSIFDSPTAHAQLHTIVPNAWPTYDVGDLERLWEIEHSGDAKD